MTTQWTAGDLTVAIGEVPSGVMISWRWGSDPWAYVVAKHTAADALGALLVASCAEIGVALRRAAGATDEEIGR